MKRLGWLLALVVWCAACGAQQDEASAPVRAGRLTYFAGAVEVQRADNTGVDEPVLNMPIAEGTRLVCSDYGQAEVEFEDGSLLRVTPRSSVSIDMLGLQGGVAQTGMTVLGGLVYFELRKSPGYSYAVSAGGVAMAPVENAEVRVALGDGPAEFAVLSGTVRVDGGFTTEVQAGESVRADAKDASRYFLSAQIALESWDSWNGERDRAAADETERRTAARDDFAGVQGYGWSDLDANGTWYDVPGEGQVWQPYAADEGFDPYGYGGWVWQSLGYVWASGYQWGWTPFRCGRWEYFPGFGWGWIPDARCKRWGSEGGVVLVGSRRPEHYKPTLAPPKGPVKTHPILYVRGPNGPRPPVLTGGEKQIHGKAWVPLAVVGSVARTGPALGLSRDYPVNPATHVAVQGRVAKDDGVVAGSTDVAGHEVLGAGWRAVEARPAPGAATGTQRTPPVATEPTSAPVSQRPVQEPMRTSVPVQAPVRTIAPVPQRPAPAPTPPPPVYRAPAPPPPPAAAPPKVDTSKPK